MSAHIILRYLFSPCCDVFIVCDTSSKKISLLKASRMLLPETSIFLLLLVDVLENLLSNYSDRFC